MATQSSAGVHTCNLAADMALHTSHYWFQKAFDF